MRFVRLLAVRLLVALLVPELVEWYVVVVFFPLSDAQRQAVRLVVPVLLVVTTAVLLLAGAMLAMPIGRALGLGADLRGEARTRAAIAALHLPGRLGALMLLLGGALVVGIVGLELRLGVPLDLALAAAGAGAAFDIMAAMLGYSVAATAIAPAMVALAPAGPNRGGGPGASIALGSDELPRSGTMRGKILVICYGLLAIATLLVGSVAYARYRADADDQYLQQALSAQEHGARWLESRGPAAAAELVYLSTGATTAVVSSDGTVAARSDGADPGVLSALPAPGSGTEEVPGGWVLRRAAGRFTLLSFLSEAPLVERREAFWGQASSLGLVLFVATVLLIWLAAKSLTVSIGFLGTAAGRIASGDLTASPPSVSTDEMGQLAADFRKMAQGLAALVTEVKAASGGVQEGTLEMDEIGQRVNGGAREEHERVLAVQAAVEAMQDSVAMVGRGVEGLTDYVRSTSSAVGEMAAALDEVRRQAADLERRTGTAGADIEKLTEAGRQAQTRLGSLDALASSAQGSLASVSASLSGLETSAIASQLASAQAAEMANTAEGVVHEAVNGIESLRSAVGDAKKRVTVLGRRSDDIDQILDFIGEVAGRTNLLSLNASIIATQAGAHGKAFGVVADQIRELAAQISLSTKSVGDIIRAVRDDVNGTARLIDRGDELAGEGVAHVRKTLGALHEIRVATDKGHETAAAIRDAVQEHARSTRDVSDLVTSVSDNTDSIAEAIQLVGKSVAAAGSVTHGVGALADKVSRALEEQSSLGRMQLESLERINAKLLDITRAVDSHDVATQRVLEVLSHLTRTAEQHEAAVVELSGVADRLGNRSRALADRVGRFKI